MKYLLLITIAFSCLLVKSQPHLTLNQHDTAILVIYEPNLLGDVGVLCNNYTKLYAIGSVKKSVYLVGWVEKNYGRAWQGEYHLRNVDPNSWIINFKTKKEAQYVLDRMYEDIKIRKLDDSITILKYTYKKCDR